MRSTLRILIAEDDDAQLKALQEWIGLLRPEWSVVATATDPRGVISGIEDAAPDLLLLDIHLGGSLGRGWLQQLPVGLPIIFVTGDPDFAIEAFDLQAVDYILKPVTLRRMKVALSRAATDPRLSALSPSDQSASGAADGLGRPSLEGDASGSGDDSPLHWLSISRGNEVVLSPVTEVIYLQADLKYTRVVSCRGDGLVRMGITELCERIAAPGFVRIHRSVVVNLNFVVSVRRNEVGQMDVHLKGRSETLRVSKTFQHVFRMS